MQPSGTADVPDNGQPSEEVAGSQEAAEDTGVSDDGEKGEPGHAYLSCLSSDT